jgi:hypothetical protein
MYVVAPNMGTYYLHAEDDTAIVPSAGVRMSSSDRDDDIDRRLFVHALMILERGRVSIPRQSRGL